MGGKGRGGERKDAAGGKKDLRGAVKQEVREEEEEIAGELETPSFLLFAVEGCRLKFAKRASSLETSSWFVPRETVNLPPEKWREECDWN